MAVGISKNGLRSIWDKGVLSLRYDKVHRLAKQCEELKEQEEEGLDTKVATLMQFPLINRYSLVLIFQH